MRSEQSGLGLTPEVLSALADRLPAVGEETVDAIMAEVPAYADAFAGPMGQTIAQAVQVALRAFVSLAAAPTAPSPTRPAVDGAYALGRGEARSGRSMDALLAAYRVGARVSWRELSRVATANGASATVMARFAELVFAYIDELSASSVAGHADELRTSGRVQERYREHLARQLIGGAAPEALLAAADRAGWVPPATLSAVIVSASQARGALATLDQRTLSLTVTLPGGDEDDAMVLLAPDSHRGRVALARRLRGHAAVIGPARPWLDARTSYRRAVRGVGLPDRTGQALDTDHHLAALVTAADPEALADLRARALAPLSELSETSRAKLTETLRSWLLHQGRRDAVAEELFVHPQTVRYRVGQLRELYGDRLSDPAWVRDLVIALG